MHDINNRLSVSDRQRILIVDHVLNSTDFCADNSLDNVRIECGIHKLIAKKAFDKAYPLHDSEPKQSTTDPNTVTSLRTTSMRGARRTNERHNLDTRWAQFRHFLSKQPLDDIRSYYGEKIALYFACWDYWLQLSWNILLFLRFRV